MNSAESSELLVQARNKCGEEHAYLLAHWDRLNAHQQRELCEQIYRIDFELLQREFASKQQAMDWASIAQRAEPPEAVRLGELTESRLEQASREGGRAIAQGKVAMVLVAGGQGTRLGFDHPKGLFPIGPVSGRTLFQMHADSLRGAIRRFGVSIPLLIMTGPSTDTPTREYFKKNSYLGLDPNDVLIFPQGNLPAIDAQTGRILLESPGSISMSPDGHGGIVDALGKIGWYEIAKERGIEQLFYAQVDNPLVRACDPLLIGLHRSVGAQVTTQVVQKRFAAEKVGNVVRIDGKTQIIEYSDLPESIAQWTNPDGSLKLWAGNIAVHVFDVDLLERSSHRDSQLPLHRAHKSVPYVNRQGELHQPKEPNAIKFERFVFDLLPMAKKSLVVEALASESFAPVKNADGAATDTPASCRKAISELHARWLSSAGVTVEPGCSVEINPTWAWDEQEVQSRIHEPAHLITDTYFT